MTAIDMPNDNDSSSSHRVLNFLHCWFRWVQIPHSIIQVNNPMFQNFPIENFNKGGVVQLYTLYLRSFIPISPEISSIRSICRVCSDFPEIRTSATSPHKMQISITLHRRRITIKLDKEIGTSDKHRDKHRDYRCSVFLEVSRTTVICTPCMLYRNRLAVYHMYYFLPYRLCMMPCQRF